MKIKLPVLVLLSGAAFISTAANAADGTINFSGTITAAACSVSPTSASQSVVLGNIAATGFTAAGDTASPTAFGITLTGCPITVSTASAKFDGPGDANNPSIITLSSGQTATGVGVAIYESDSSTLIPVGTPSAPKTVTSAGPNTLNFIAKYMSTLATVNTGSANAVTTFTMMYN